VTVVCVLALIGPPGAGVVRSVSPAVVSSVEVIDPRTGWRPLDVQTILSSVHKTGRLLIVDEAFSPFAWAPEVAANVADAGFDDLDAPIRRLQRRFHHQRQPRNKPAAGKGGGAAGG